MPSVSLRHSWTRLLAGGVISALAAAVVLAGIPTLFGAPLPMVRVYWRGISDADRVAAEQRFRLSEATRQNGETWSYVPLDTSVSTLRAIVTHPSVEDTDGINRRTATMADRPPLTPRRGGLIDNAPGWMAGAARLLAYALAGLSALLCLAAGTASPLAGPGSTFGRRLSGQVRDPASALRRLPESTFAGVRRRVTPASVQATAVIGVFVATVIWRFLTFTGFTNDHYAHLALAQQMLLGDRPIRDFADPGWPLTYLLTAAGWVVAGNAMGTEWAITATGFALGAACTFAVARRLSKSLAIALLVTIFEVLIFPRSYSYPKMLVYGAGAWIMFALARHPSSQRIAVAAAAIAIAFLFRHDHGLFIGFAAAVCLALTSRADGWRVALRRVATLTGATALFLLPWTLFVALNGGLVDYFRAGLDYSRGEAAATALTALPRMAFNSPGASMSNAEAWVFWLFWSLPVACGAIAWRRARRHQERWPGEFATVAGLIVVGVLVNASFIRQALQVRLPDAIVPAALLAAWGMGICWTEPWRRRSYQWVMRIATIACIVVSGAMVSRISRVAEQYDDSALGRGMSGLAVRAAEVSALLRSPHREDNSSRYATTLQPFFAYLDRCSSTSDRLIVTGEFPDILVLAGRRFAGDGVVFGAWYSSATHQDRTLERLRADPALFALHMGDYATFRQRFGLIDRYLNEEYAPMADVPVVEGGIIRILALRSRPTTGVDATTGWPCFTRNVN